MKAVMIRKALSAKDWLERATDIKELFGKEPEAVEVVVEKTVTLSKAEFKEIADNLLDDHKIIAENKDIMRVDENGIWHVLKIKGRGMPYSILIDSEGYDYARYSAIRVD